MTITVIKSGGILKVGSGARMDVAQAAAVTAGFGEARDWDGATRNRVDGAAPTGVTDGRTGTLSCWLKPGQDTNEMTILTWVDQIGGGAIGGFVRTVAVAGGVQLIVNLFNTSVQQGIAISHAGPMVVNDWHHFMCSWENTFPVDAANNLTCYFDGAEQLDGVGAAVLSQANSDFDLAYNAKGNAWTQGSKSENFDGGGFGGPKWLDGCVSNLYFNIDERMDLTVLANREKFRTGAAGQANGVQVDLGADGSTPTGSQPAFYAANGELNTNQGYADDIPVITGAVTDCADAPPTS